jgi:hypothetical protein
MNVFELFLLIVFVGGGAAIGSHLAGGLGTLFGALAGFLLRIAIGYLVRRELLILPDCECGAPGSSLVVEPNQIHASARRCNLCSRAYVMRKGVSWYSHQSVVPFGVIGGLHSNSLNPIVGAGLVF